MIENEKAQIVSLMWVFRDYGVAWFKYRWPLIMSWVTYGLTAWLLIDVCAASFRPALIVLVPLLLLGVWGWHRVLVAFVEQFPVLSPFQTFGDRPSMDASTETIEEYARRMIPQVFESWVLEGCLSTEQEYAAGRAPFLMDPYVRAKMLVFPTRIGTNRDGSAQAMRRARPLLASMAGVPNLLWNQPNDLLAEFIVPFADPFADVESLTAPIITRDYTFGVAIGKNDIGELVFLRLRETAGVLVTGTPGSGKTVMLTTLIRSLQAAGAQTTVLDLKAGGDFAGLGPSVVEAGNDIKKARELLDKGHQAMRRRLDKLAATEGPANYWLRSPAFHRANPPIVIVIDEVQELLPGAYLDKSAKATAEEALRHLEALVKLGRGAGFTVVLAPQKSDVTNIPSSIRDQVTVRLTGRQLTKEASRASMGELPDEGPFPHELPPVPGRMIIFGSQAPTVFQAFKFNELESEGGPQS